MQMTFILLPALILVVIAAISAVVFYAAPQNEDCNYALRGANCGGCVVCKSRDSH